MPRPPTDRESIRAAILALIDSHPGPLTVTVTYGLTPVAAFQLLSAAEPQTETPCAQDVLYVVGEAQGPLTTPMVLDELQRRGMVHGEDTVKKTLARLVREEKLSNPDDARPRGYRLGPKGGMP